MPELESVPETVDDFQKAWDAEMAASGGGEAEPADLTAEASDEVKALAEELSASSEEAESETEESGDDAPGGEEEAEAEPEPNPEKEEKAEAESGISPAAAKLIDELKKHGFDVDGRQVVSQERKHFREKVRKQYAEIEQFKHQAAQELEQTGKSIEERFAPYMELEEAVKSQDMDRVASILSKRADLGEAKTWLDFNKNHYERMQSPIYREQQKLKRQLEEERAAREAAIAEQRNALQEEKRNQARMSWRDDVVDQMEASDDQTVSALAGDDMFVEQVIQIQEQQYQKTGTVPTAEQAAGLALAGARAMYEKLSKIFGTQTASSSEKPDGVANAGEPILRPNSGKKGGGNPKKSVSQRKATEASGKVGDYIPDDEWLKEATSAMKEANKSV